MQRVSLFLILMTTVVFLFVIPAMALGTLVDAESTNEIDSVTLTFAPAWGIIDELVDTVITIRFAPGTVHVQKVRQQAGAVEEEKLLIAQKKDLTELVSALCEHEFFNMDKRLETDVMDGYFTWVTVNLQSGESKTVGGLVAEKYGPEGFIAICDAIDQVVQNSHEFPNWPADERLLPEAGQEGTQLYVFLDVNGITERIAAELPSRASVCHYTVAGGTPYLTEDEATIRRVANALAEMAVFEADGWGHTDDYLVYSLEWTDGTSFSVTFQGGMLLGNKEELYPVIGLDALIQALPSRIVIE
jgi:hypothetical protein